jgi:hypothetical protein
MLDQTVLMEEMDRGQKGWWRGIVPVGRIGNKEIGWVGWPEEFP